MFRYISGKCRDILCYSAIFRDIPAYSVVFRHSVFFTTPGPEVFLGLAHAKCEKTPEEKGKTSGEFGDYNQFQRSL